MGYLNTYNTTDQAYYQGNDLGNYQFTSLENIITQFQIAYVGENKLIPKLKKADVSFHAMRALQELSFDTFHSVKAQQITVPASLTMKLPHDYVNYTKVSWVDDCGIKHPIYPIRDTSNPFEVSQDENGEYVFETISTVTQIPGADVLVNGDFAINTGVNGYPTSPWFVNGPNTNPVSGIGTEQQGFWNENNELNFYFRLNSPGGVAAISENVAFCHVMWQEIDVTDTSTLEIKGTGNTRSYYHSTVSDTGSLPSASDIMSESIIRFGISTQEPSSDARFQNSIEYPVSGLGAPHDHNSKAAFDLLNDDSDPSYIEWNSAGVLPDHTGSSGTASTDNTSTQTLSNIDVSGVNTVYAVIVAFVDSKIIDHATFVDVAGGRLGGSLDNLTVTKDNTTTTLTESATSLTSDGSSSTWTSYKGCSPSENNNDDYEDDTYWPAHGERYGLDPEHAQVNGSYYIDQRLGKIHFSSNISGKTIVLDYISDGIGTDAEMRVHKFAEEAMYKFMAHAVLSTSNYGQALVPRLTKEKFAAIRKAKLRLSNIKLHELTQVLRGKSKQIKH